MALDKDLDYIKGIGVEAFVLCLKCGNTSGAQCDCETPEPPLKTGVWPHEPLSKKRKEVDTKKERLTMEITKEFVKKESGGDHKDKKEKKSFAKLLVPFEPQPEEIIDFHSQMVKQVNRTCDIFGFSLNFLMGSMTQMTATALITLQNNIKKSVAERQLKAYAVVLGKRDGKTLWGYTSNPESIKEIEDFNKE